MKNIKTIFSVIIPVYNDPKGLSVTLESLINQTYPKDEYEIVVVDNNSTDETPIIIRDYEKRFPNLITGLTEKKIQSSYAARNKGIKNSNGKIIAFIDANMYVKKNWLSQVDNFLKTGEIKYLGCNVKINIKRKTIAALYNKYSDFGIKRYIEHGHFAPTCCLIVSKDLFNKFGLFDQKLISGGDNEFGNRIFKEGVKLYYSPNIKMYHPARDSIKSLIIKKFRIGRGIFRLKKIYPEDKDKFKRSIFNTKIFILNFPKVLSTSIMDWEKISFQLKITFCLFYFFIAIVSHLGYLYEKYKQ